MAVTRIKNNQITDSTVNAAAKLVDFSITAGKLANNITYGSDWTITGNLTVNGQTTTIDTVSTVIEDPVIVLASNQSGAPAVDIGFIGERGTSNNIAFVWDESTSEFVTVYTTDTITNTVVTISSYANFHTNDANIGGNIVINGTTSLVGNIVGSANATGNVTSGNLLTPGLISATGNVTGGNITTGGQVSATGNITANYYFGNGSQLTGLIADSATALVNGNTNITTAANGNANVTIGGTSNVVVFATTGQYVTGLVSANGNVTGGNILTGGLISVTGGITAASVVGGVITGSSVSVTGTTTAASVVGGVITGSSTSVTGTTTAASVVGGVITGSSTSVTGTTTAASVVGGVITGSSTSVTGTTTAASVVGGVITGTSVSVSGNVDGGNVNTGGLISATGNITGGNISTAGQFGAASLSASGNVTGGNILTAGLVSATANVTGGNLLTAGLVSATSTITSAANITGGNVLTGGLVSATANITGGNVLTGGLISATGNITGGNISTAGQFGAASLSASGNVDGGNINTGGLVSATGGIFASAVSAATIGNTGATINGTTISASGNITIGNVLTGGQVSATGNITGGNINTNNIVGTTISITGNSIALIATTGNIDVNSRNINNLATPVADSDAANKSYVDSVAQGLDPKASVVYASANALPAYTYDNGASGVGATITANAVGALSIDSSTPSQGARVLIKNETSTNQPYNGIYTVTTVGSGAAAFVLTRSTDFDASTEIPGAFTFVEAGSTNADTGWVCTTNAPVTVGTTNIVFTQFSGAGSYTANTAAGLSLTGSVFSAKVDEITTAFDGSGNIVVKNSAQLTTPNIGAATGTSLSVTGTLTGASVVGGVMTGSSLSVTGTTTAASVVGGVITGSSTSVTGTTTAASVVGGVITGTSISVSGNVDGGNVNTGGNVTGGNVLTGGLISATGNITGGNISTAGQFGAASLSASGNVTGGNVLTGGLVSATANVTGGNILTGGLISATSTITSAANITGGNINTGGLVSATANITGGNLLTAGLASVTGNITGGNVLTGGLISVTGNITANYYFGNGSQLTGLIADSATALVNGNTNITTAANGNANVTIGGTSNVVVFATTGQYVTGLVSVSGNIDGGNLATGGTASAGGNITGGNLLTGGLVSATANITGGNLLTGGLVSATANITGGNINTAGQLIGGNIVISGDNITDTNGRINFNTALGDVDTTINGTAANVFYVDAGTNTASFGNARQITNALVSFNSSNSILFPVGNTNQRPSVGVTGMLRFNTSTNAVEVYDNSTWTGVGQTVFTVIADEQFNGDGATTVFTLSSSQTTSSCIVSINGVVQIPTLAYSVSGTTLTFTEAPASGDVIDVRELTTTTTITSISNSPANAVISVQDTSDVVQVTGQLSVTGGIIGLNSSSISNGTSNLAVIASNGNIRANVNGATIATFWSGGINNGQANGVGNIGTASSYFNTVFAQATSAQYADLAEMYAADASYAPGTVLSFGGANEVTKSNIDSDRRVAGVVSTNPSYIMNAGQAGDNVVAVALTGRVPTSVTGSVTKGDLMVSNGDGTARAEADPRVGTVIGKALADSEGNTVIEVVVGRF